MCCLVSVRLAEGMPPVRVALPGWWHGAQPRPNYGFPPI
eukprot:gene10219-3680_t